MEKSINQKTMRMIWHLTHKVFQFEVEHGHLQWKVSDLARAARVTRTSIYYHLGSSKKEIFYKCFSLVATHFYGLGAKADENFKKGHLTDGLLYSKRIIDANPYIMALAYKWRNIPSPLSKELIGLEKQFQTRLKKFNPHLDNHQILALQALFHGATTAPYIDEKGLVCLADLIVRIQNGKVRLK